MQACTRQKKKNNKQAGRRKKTEIGRQARAHKNAQSKKEPRVYRYNPLTNICKSKLAYPLAGFNCNSHLRVIRKFCVGGGR
jgi:hypothetical protein